MKLSTKILIGFLFYFAAMFIVGGVSAGISDGAQYFVISIIGLAIGYFTFKYMRRKQTEAEEQEELEQEQKLQPKAAPPQHHIRLVAPDEEVEEDEEEEDDYEDMSFSIKGINYTNLDDSYLGDHEGYIKAVTNNPKDPYAIGVFVGRKRVGWLPAGNKELHAGLLSIGGKAKVSIVISKGYDDFDDRPFYYGKATIQK